MKNNLKLYFGVIALLFMLSCKKEDSKDYGVNVMYEVAGKNHYHVSFFNENGDWVRVDSITTGWRYQKEFPKNVKPEIQIQRAGDTSFIDISYLRIYVGFSKFESIDTSYSNIDRLNAN